MKFRCGSVKFQKLREKLLNGRSVKMVDQVASFRVCININNMLSLQ